MKAKLIILMSVLLSIVFVSCKTSNSKSSFETMDPEELAQKYPLIMICNETPKTVKLAKKKGYTFLTAKKLKKILLEDTTHYKFVIFYSPCCGGKCEQQLSQVYPQVLEKVGSKKVKWYYVLDNTGGVAYDDDYRERYGIEKFEKYCLHDSKFPTANGYLTNITNYVFDNDIKITEDLGTPTNFIVNKEGKILKCLNVYKDGVELICPSDLSLILDKDLEDIDFNKIDTVRIPYSKYKTKKSK